MTGVSGLALDSGGIRFEPVRAPQPPIQGGFSPLPYALQIDPAWVIDAAGRRADGRWTIIEEEGKPRRIRLTIDCSGLEFPLVVDPSFSSTQTMMNHARGSHTATLLSNGKVLIAGGFAGTSYLNTAELYDPGLGKFTATAGTMTSSRAYHVAVALPNGKVLLAGGLTAGGLFGTPLSSAELYDPATDSFTAVTGNMAVARTSPTATLLPSGKVLLAGGSQGLGSLSSAELFDPAGGTNGTFTAVAVNMTVARNTHTATLLPSGKVLIAGGSSGFSVLGSAELYDPAGGTNGTFTAVTVNMTAPRTSHTATLLANGQVLIAGGSSTSGAILNTAELYDPNGGTNGTFAAAGGVMNVSRSGGSATLLSNGKVLIAGGTTTGGGYLNAAELYDPAFNQFLLSTYTMTAKRSAHTATLLPNGQALVAGGYDGTAYSNTAEVFDSTGFGLGTYLTESSRDIFDRLSTTVGPRRGRRGATGEDDRGTEDRSDGSAGRRVASGGCGSAIRSEPPGRI